MKTLIAAAITACFLIGLLSLNGCIHLSHYPPSKYIGLVDVCASPLDWTTFMKRLV